MYISENCTVTFEDNEIKVESIEIEEQQNNDILAYNNLWKYRVITGTMKILEYNPRFWIITPFDNIRYYLRRLRTKIMKILGVEKDGSRR